MAKHSARGADWDAQRKRVLDRDGWTCQNCAKPLVGADATVDHTDPISLDPTHTYSDDELRALCRSCNGRKGDKTMERQAWLNPSWLPAGVAAAVAFVVATAAELADDLRRAFLGYPSEQIGRASCRERV